MQCRGVGDTASRSRARRARGQEGTCGCQGRGSASSPQRGNRQLNDKGISFFSETEPEDALRAREELLTALQGRNVSIGMTHFPGLDFQRIATADGREWTTAG